jgi:hypothetical protein
MSPMQRIVIENKALRRFTRKYGYCLKTACVVRMAEERLCRQGGATQGERRTIYCDNLQLRVKRRYDQWIVTEINIVEE